jgi:hypothetical protein
MAVRSWCPRLDLAVSTLDGLRGRHRLVGIVGNAHTVQERSPLGTWAGALLAVGVRPRSRPPIGVRPRCPAVRARPGRPDAWWTLWALRRPSAVLTGARGRGRLPQPGLAPGTSSLSGTFAGCVQAGRATDDQPIGLEKVTVAVRSVPGLTARCGTRVERDEDEPSSDLICVGVPDQPDSTTGDEAPRPGVSPLTQVCSGYWDASKASSLACASAWAAWVAATVPPEDVRASSVRLA